MLAKPYQPSLPSPFLVLVPTTNTHIPHSDSDIDLGLFGKMHGCELLALAPNQAKKLLYQVLGGVTRGKLAVGQVRDRDQHNFAQHSMS